MTDQQSFLLWPNAGAQAPTPDKRQQIMQMIAGMPQGNLGQGLAKFGAGALQGMNGGNAFPATPGASAGDMAMQKLRNIFGGNSMAPKGTAGLY